MSSGTTRSIEAVLGSQGSGRRLAWWAFRLLATLALAAFLVWQVGDEWGRLRYRIRQPGFLVLAAASAVLAVLISAWIWRCLIPRDGRPPFGRVLTLYLQGLLWNHFLPGGLGGDAVRAGGLWAGSGRADSAVSSVLMARLAGLWSVVLLAVAAALTHTPNQGRAEMTSWLAIAAGTLAFALAGTLLLFSRPFAAVADRLPGQWGRWHASLRHYRRRPGLLLQVLAWSLVVQGCAVAVNVFTARAFNLSITPGMLLLAVPLVSLSVMLPVSIGGFGLREAAYLYFLGLFGVRASDAIVLSLAVTVLLTLVSAGGAALCRALIPPGGSAPV